MTKKLLGLTLALAMISSPAWAKKKEEEPINCGRRVTVAVDRFKTENISVGWWNDDVALNSREVLVDELVQSGCFNVLEREDYSMAPAGVMNEKALARSGEARKGSKAAKKGRMKVAENLASCALTGVNKDGSGFSIGGGGGGGGLGGGGLGGLGLSTKQSEVSIACKIFSTSSSEILASARVTRKANSFGIGAAGGGWGGGGGGGGGLGFFKESKVGKMMAEAIHEAVRKMASNMRVDD